MAGASSKRIAQANAATLKQLNLGFAISGAIYLLHLAVFSSGRSYRRLFLFATTEAVAIGLWNMMKSMAARGEELNGSKGLVSYMFDVVYITWGVHVAAALLTAKAWYIYWVIPLYALYRLVTVFLPTLRSLAGSAGASTAGAGAGGAGGAGANEPLSKRQEKLRKRMERGDQRVQQRTR